jgi:hypothetical protein
MTKKHKSVRKQAISNQIPDNSDPASDIDQILGIGDTLTSDSQTDIDDLLATTDEDTPPLHDDLNPDGFDPEEAELLGFSVGRIEDDTKSPSDLDPALAELIDENLDESDDYDNVDYY